MSSTDDRLTNHEHRLEVLERAQPCPPAYMMHRRPKPLLHTVCKCDERPSTFNSTSAGPIPLSFKGRHLMMWLRDAMAEAFTAGYHTPSLSKARAAIARRMGELEARNGEADTFKSALSICQDQLRAANYRRDAAMADLVKAQHEAYDLADVTEQLSFERAAWQKQRDSDIAEITSLRRDVCLLKSVSPVESSVGFIPGRDALVVEQEQPLALSIFGVALPKLMSVSETAWDGKTLRIALRS